jgi:hypothetical protein
VSAGGEVSSLELFVGRRDEETIRDLDCRLRAAHPSVRKGNPLSARAFPE